MASKKLQAPTAKPIVLGALVPNAGVEEAYRKQLQDLVTAMSKSVIYWTRAAWRKDDPTEIVDLAQDAKPMQALRRSMRKMIDTWQAKFDALAPELAKVFVDGATSTTQAAFQAELAKAGFAVKFQMTPAMREGYQAVLSENVALIKSIPSQYLTQVEGDVWRAVSQGYDLESLTSTLQQRYGVTHRRASFIAKDQASKAKSITEKVRRLELGITKAIWRHSHGGREPRPSHVKAGADKLVYDIAKGAYIDGEWIQPGYLPRCGCSSRAIIPGLEEDD